MLYFSVGEEAFVIGLSQISSFFSCDSGNVDTRHPVATSIPTDHLSRSLTAVS